MRLALIAALLAAVPAIVAAQTINERQDSLFARIDEGVRNRALTREEAQRLRAEFYDIARLEEQYRYNGIDQRERRDLNQRFDALSSRINRERADTERVPQALYDRRAQLDRNIQDGLRGGGLTRQEADGLYYELQAYDQQMNAYRRSGDGLDAREREDLSRRLEQIAQRILAQRRDGEQGSRNDRYYSQDPYNQNNGYGRNDRRR